MDATPPPWVEFPALVESVHWGRSTYTVLRLDPSLERQAEEFGTRRVEGTLDDVLVNLGVNRAPVLPGTFAYVGRPLLRRLGVQPGDVVECRLRPADPDAVLVPDDVLRALEDADALGGFEARRPAERRRLLQPVEEAARPLTRQERIRALVREVTGRP